MDNDYRKAAEPYWKDIEAAARKYGVDPDLVARTFYRESRYRPDVIEGRTRSGAGAVGIAQIHPPAHPNYKFGQGVSSDIDYGTKVLADYTRMYGGDERKGVAAYNWGPGNLNRALKQHGEQWLENAPQETRIHNQEIIDRLYLDPQQAANYPKTGLLPAAGRAATRAPPVEQSMRSALPTEGSPRGIYGEGYLAQHNTLFPRSPKPAYDRIGRQSSAALATMASGEELDDSDLEALIPGPAAAMGDTQWSDYPKAFMSGVGQLGGALAGAGEYVSGQLGAEGAEEWFRKDRQDAEAFATGWFTRMSPEAQERTLRHWTSLDPTNTIWQGGVGEFISSIGLKATGSLPSTLVTLVPGGIMMRAGLGARGLSYLGASEAVLSMGGVAQNINDEIEQASEQELNESQRYRELRTQMGETDARRQLSHEAQGATPAIAGAVTGVLGAAMGRVLSPVFQEGATLGRRAAIGFGEEAAQESTQSMSDQVAQNYAAQTYDTARSLGAGVAEAGIEGGVIGGVTGAGTAALLGRGPQPPPPPPPPVPPAAFQGPPSPNLPGFALPRAAAEAALAGRRPRVQ